MYFLLRVHLTVKRHSREIESQRPRDIQEPFNLPRIKKSVKVMYLVVGAFAIFYLPYIGCVGALAIKGMQDTTIVLAYRITESIVLLNSLINPSIYYWRIQELRNATKRLMCG